MAREAAVTIHALRKQYGPTLALETNDLTIREGERLAILGPNGAGKTTLISLVLGLLRPSAGTVHVYSKEPRAATIEGLIGAMLQETTLPSHVTPRELLHHVAGFYRNPLTAAECVAKTGIEAWADRRVERLSGGQRRQVMFALALIGRPRLIFLDEPTTGMDVEAREAFWTRLSHLDSEQGVTVCFATHDLTEADRYANRILVLYRGRIAADGSPHTLKTQLGSARVRFRCARPVSTDELSQWLGVPVVPGSLPGTFEAQDADTDRLLRILAADPSCSEFRTLSDTLDDVWHAVTAGAGERGEAGRARQASVRKED